MAPGNPALAARCTSCQTVFRVVPDQLRVSGGWVRCGRCAAVFNAAENLVELDDGVVRRSVRLAVPAAATPEPDIDISSRPQGLGGPHSPQPGGVVATSDGAMVPDWADTDVHDDRPADFDVDAHAHAHANANANANIVDGGSDAVEPGPQTAPPALPSLQGPATVTAPGAEPDETVAERSLPPFDDAPGPLAEGPPADHATAAAMQAFQNTQAMRAASAADAAGAAGANDLTAAAAAAAAAGAANAALAAGASDAARTTADADGAADAESTPTPRAPSFVRSADRAAHWRQPRVRIALGGLALAAALGLVAQVLIEYRDLAAARWPALRPVLVAFCDVAGCRVDAARSIDGLAVESSGLVRVERSDRYGLSVTLRNRAGIELALPAIDLSLTDGQGRLIARRVLSLAEIGATQPTLPAGRELSLQATLRAATGVSGEAVTGYTIELFYP